MSLPDNHFIIFVHGTFGRESEWISPRSELSLALNKKFPNAPINAFLWSGHNTHIDRLNASKLLANEILQLRDKHSDCRVSLIAHSHGGNICKMAFDLLGKNHIDDIICIATPFLLKTSRFQQSELFGIKLIAFYCILVSLFFPLLLVLFLFDVGKLDIARDWKDIFSAYMFFIVLPIFLLTQGSIILFQIYQFYTIFLQKTLALFQTRSKETIQEQDIAINKPHHTFSALIVKTEYDEALWYLQAIRFIQESMFLLIISASRAISRPLYQVFAGICFFAITSHVQDGVGSENVDVGEALGMGLSSIFSLIVPILIILIIPIFCLVVIFMIFVFNRYVRGSAIGFGPESFIEALRFDLQVDSGLENCFELLVSPNTNLLVGRLRHSDVCNNQSTIHGICRFIELNGKPIPINEFSRLPSRRILFTRGRLVSLILIIFYFGISLDYYFDSKETAEHIISTPRKPFFKSGL